MTTHVPAPGFRVPAAIEAEQALLGAILLNQEALQAVPFLQPEDFVEGVHGALFGLLRRLHAEGTRLTLVSLKPYVAGWPPVDGMTVPQYLGRLVAQATTVINAHDYGRAIVDAAIRRGMIEAGARLQTLAQNAALKVVDALADGFADLNALSARSRAERTLVAPIGDTVHAVIETLVAGKRRDTVTTGLSDLDRALGGWHPGELAVVGARPSMGKSTFAVMTAVKMAASGHGVYFASLEMTAEALAARALSDAVWNRQTPIAYEAMRRGVVEPHDIDRLSRAAAGLRDMPLILDETPGLTTDEIAARVRTQADALQRQGRTLTAVVVDHLGKVRASDRYRGHKVHETGEKVAALATLAKDLHVAVIALHQLNRGVEGRDDKRPSLADLRDSGDVEQDADTVMFLYRPAYYVERAKCDDPELEANRKALLERTRHDLEIIVAKNRNGPCRTVEAFIDVASNVIRDRSVR